MSEEESREYAIMERADEKQILAELQGRYLEEFVYHFEVGGRRITGLSWAGVKECAIRLGGIDVVNCDIQDKSDCWVVVCRAVDKIRGNSMFGASTQAKTLKRKDGSEEPDLFALQKAMSKAQRNAIRALIPELFIKTFINRYMESRAPKKVSAEEVEPITKPSEVPRASPETIPEFNPEDLMQHKWRGKGKKTLDGYIDGYEDGSLAFGWDFRENFALETISALENGPLTIDQYEFTLADRIVQTKKRK